MSTTGFDPDDRLPSRPKSHAEATAHIQAQDAAARRGYAAGSRDGAREMRLKAARLVAGAGCVGNFGACTGDPDHAPHCPAALAEAIRRLSDDGEGE